MTGEGVGTPGVLHVEGCMGTVFTIAVRDPGDWDDAVSEVLVWLHRVDAVFSTYRPGSDISRIRSGQLSIAGADPLVGEVLDLCDRYARKTDGYFTAYLPGGVDPTGLVKGWAIERASGLLRARGSDNHAVNGGGDMQMAGEAAPGQPWNVGIIDPHDPTRILTVVTGRDFAVATSGVAERGEHIINPHAARPARDLASVTVIGGALSAVDAYATAAFAMGPHALSWLDAQPLDGLVVSADGSCRRTRGFVNGMRVGHSSRQGSAQVWHSADSHSCGVPVASPASSLHGRNPS